MREAKRIRSYQGNRHPFCCALFAKADRQEAMAVLETLDRQRIRIALPALEAVYVDEGALSAVLDALSGTDVDVIVKR